MSERPPDFIGLGAQKAATSWIYACLYEHSEICAPEKEIHFFSRDRNWSKGYEWYEGIFGKCPPNAKAGEFSTSYLSDQDTPLRIYQRYPNIKLIASLRNPVDRAYSNYRNDIIAGVVKAETSFEEALKFHPEYIEHGRYAKHLKQYLDYFDSQQILILIYEDISKNPLSFIQSIYRFLEANDKFVPSMLHTKVNPHRVPRSPKFELFLDRISILLRNRGLHNLWWFAKRTGLGDKIRRLNTVKVKKQQKDLTMSTRRYLSNLFREDIEAVEEILERTLKEWRI